MASTEVTTWMTPGDLALHESVIERGQTTFVEVGLALQAIREGHGYRTAGCVTFEEYCKKRWGWSSNYGRRLVQAANFTEELKTKAEVDDKSVPRGTLLSSTFPTTEKEARRQMREQRNGHAEPKPAAEPSESASATAEGDASSVASRPRLAVEHVDLVVAGRGDLAPTSPTQVFAPENGSARADGNTVASVPITVSRPHESQTAPPADDDISDLLDSVIRDLRLCLRKLPGDSDLGSEVLALIAAVAALQDRISEQVPA
jgi:hypothetical protein